MTDWTPVEVRPLHAGNQPDQWWACQQPERPPDDLCCWDYRCRPCALHAWATIQAGARDEPVMAAHGPASDLAPRAISRYHLCRAALAELHGVEAAS